MLRKIIILSILIFIVLGVYGYFKSVPPPSDESSAKPKIVLSSNFFDFGNLEFGKVAEAKFTIKNEGGAVLEITRLTTSCSCTSAKAAKNSLEPGEETELSVRYDTAAMGNSSHGKGRQDRIIYLKTNDPVNPQTEITTTAL